MSEVSREETINIIEKLRACWGKDLIDCEYECDKCENTVLNTIVVESMEKAISDMEKIQKIEALYEPQEFGKGLSREERDKEVQKILDGE